KKAKKLIFDRLVGDLVFSTVNLWRIKEFIRGAKYYFVFNVEIIQLADIQRYSI
ncbi:hypothetical protein SAMN04487988_1293, partial [Algoriphagus hitonicola]